MLKALQKLFYVLCAFGGLGIIGMVSAAVPESCDFHTSLRCSGLTGTFFLFIFFFLIGICGIFFNCLHEIDRAPAEPEEDSADTSEGGPS